MPGERFINSEELPAPGEGCNDIKGRFILPGHHYVPGPDSCTVCICDGGKPKWCQAVLCAPPHECKSFRIGNSCCEFICLDNTVHSKDGIPWGKNVGTGDSGLWMMTTIVTVVFSLALLVFLVCRLRQRRLSRSRGTAAVIGSAASLGTFEAINSTSHLSRQPNVAGLENGLYLWKPPAPSYAEAAQDAPPPYSEAPSSSQQTSSDDIEAQESSGLLSAPLPQTHTPLEALNLTILSSTDTLDSDLLGRGTPPPSYSEVVCGQSSEGPTDNRLSCYLPTSETTPQSTHRLSLQLPLDFPDEDGLP